MYFIIIAVVLGAISDSFGTNVTETNCNILIGHVNFITKRDSKFRTIESQHIQYIFYLDLTSAKPAARFFQISYHFVKRVTKAILLSIQYLHVSHCLSVYRLLINTSHYRQCYIFYVRSFRTQTCGFIGFITPSWLENTGPLFGCRPKPTYVARYD